MEHLRGLTIRNRDETPRYIPPGTPIIELFDKLGGGLLILGAPGSGKTTVLLELARDLLSRAEDDAHLPIPVVFNLSSWALKRHALAEWLEDQLHDGYDVPRTVAKDWIKHGAVLPLLDGLDEVGRENRDLCVKAINSFRQEHGLLQFAVCSRTEDYNSLSIRLRLEEAVELQPPTKQQVNAYLQALGTSTEGIRAALKADGQLLNLLASPLMLSIVALAYQDRSASNLVRAISTDQRRAVLFDTYINRMFEQRAVGPSRQARMTAWLAWLAYMLRSTSQTEFSLDALEDLWLPSPLQRILLLISPTLTGTATGFLVGQMAGSIAGGLSLGLVGGFTIGLLGDLSFVTTQDEEPRAEQPPPTILYQLFWGGLAGIMISSLLSAPSLGLLTNIAVGPTFAFVGASAGVVLGAQSPNLFEESGKTEHIGVAALAVLLMGPIIGAITGGLLDDLTLGLVSGVLFAVLAVSSGMLIGAVTPGLSSERLTPNDKLRRYGLYTFIGATAGLLVGGFVGLFLESPISLAVGTFLGGIFLGGASCLQILTLRVLLTLNGLTPWRYVRFLDQATNNLLLRRSGATYVFMHRLLQDHFAQMWSGKRPTYSHAVPMDDSSLRDELSSSELKPSDEEGRVVAIQDVRSKLLSREEERSLQRNPSLMRQPPRGKAVDPSSPWAQHEDISNAVVLLERVTKVYGGSLVALDDVSLHVGEGELIVIRGPSGSGKSTLLRLMRREEHPTIGRVWVSGNDLSRLTDAELQYLRRSIGSIFEIPYLIANKTAWENISFALEVVGYRAANIRQQVDFTLSSVGLADRANYFPHEFMAEEQYLIAIGRALVNQPTLILCDSPAEGVNREGLEKIAYCMQQVNRAGVTVIVTWPSDVEMPFTEGRVCILEGGRLLCAETQRSGPEPPTAA